MTLHELLEQLPYSVLDASVYFLIWGIPLVAYAVYRFARGHKKEKSSLEREIAGLAEELKAIRALLSEEKRARLEK